MGDTALCCAVHYTSTLLSALYLIYYRENYTCALHASVSTLMYATQSVDLVKFYYELTNLQTNDLASKATGDTTHIAGSKDWGDFHTFSTFFQLFISNISLYLLLVLRRIISV